MRYIFDEDEYEHGCKWFATWHRDPSHEDDAKAIDIDLLGYCAGCLDPLYLVEATRGRNRKTAIVLEHLGEQLSVPVFVAYQDKTGAHPEQILLDDRTTHVNHGWIAEAEVWSILSSLRAEHRDGCLVYPDTG